MSSDSWKYKGPIFDAHTHTGTIENIVRMVDIEEEFGVAKQVGIVHDDQGFEDAKEQYPDRFIFARYLPMGEIGRYNLEPVLEEISNMPDRGYSIAKTWFGPRWRDYIDGVTNDFRVNHPKLVPMFQAIEDAGIPLIIHISDPDTYYANQYRDSGKYGFKDDHLKELEEVIARHPKLTFQVPHFAAQPEIHRLPELSRWLDEYPNLYIDTASSRWMARELSKDVEKAREFMIRYSDRVLYGTDVVSSRGDRDYFTGRIIAQRVLWDTAERGIPLPFPDADTADTGGTFINGLDLPMSVLKKLYWENADRLYAR